MSENNNTTSFLNKCSKCGKEIGLNSTRYIIKMKIYCIDCLKKYRKELFDIKKEENRK